MRLGILAAMGIFLIAIYFSYTRAAMISVMGMIPLFFIIKWRLIKQTLIASLFGVVVVLAFLAYNDEYLDYALLALKPAGGWIHYYEFEYAKKNEDPVEKAEKKVSEKLGKLGTDFQAKFGRIVRPIGPRWYQVVLDIHIQN